VASQNGKEQQHRPLRWAAWAAQQLHALLGYLLCLAWKALGNSPLECSNKVAHHGLCVILPCRVIIAGAGIGGLVLAVALLKQGVDVKVFERDLTAIRGEGKYRGPIQVRSM
jgi:NADPH-dependent 2,4-dienoyl-CoA reductase/sulfur reductase-like enzyme